MQKRVVVWGLRNDYHTHRYIHQGFATTFEKLGWETFWVDDRSENNGLIRNGDLVLTVNVASKKLLPKEKAFFVLHNVEDPKLTSQNHVVNLQVYTNKADGESIFSSTSLWDKDSRTLYQPWGIPSDTDSWLKLSPQAGKRDYWVGSIWNNALRQGNSEVISEYRKALKQHKLKFVQLGGAGVSLPRVFGGKSIHFRPQISEELGQMKIAISPVGASIVGNWQREVGYVPCRVFKNLASGQPIFSNSDFSNIFGSNCNTDDNLSNLVEARLSISKNQLNEMISASQNEMKNYTYSEGIKRILKVL